MQMHLCNSCTKFVGQGDKRRTGVHLLLDKVFLVKKGKLKSIIAQKQIYWDQKWITIYKLRPILQIQFAFSCKQSRGFYQFAMPNRDWDR